ncbi:hypothetical protein Pan265_07730 [Mucisphaera calidilacus]|uniref:SGNH hydrolase-type esterase domain-containing protein n=1 Tax=Mucisphaera calidilacus TaxID=2527982 RepID=A0A518BVC5_9BACT|nr:hypothetical protein Pan265_07730 [Mucisphaera calidilacus]
MSEPSERRRWPRRVLIALGVVVVLGLLGLEAYLRWGVGLGDPPLWVADPEVEYKLAANQDCRRWGNRIVVNELGMRSGPFSRTRDTDDGVRVVIVGDSVMNGGTLMDQSDLAAEVLRARLQAMTDRSIEVGNVSAGSWGPVNMAAAFDQLELEALDVVIVVVSSHDLTDMPGYGPLNEREHPTAKPFSATTEALVRYGPPLWRYLTRKPAPESDSDFQPRINMPAAEKSLSALRGLFDSARTTRAEAILVVHPDANEVTSGQLHANGRAMLAEAERLGVQTVDMLPLLREGAKEDRVHYRDVIHPSEDTHTLYAQVFEALVVEACFDE